ncbi:MAG TPA: endonuclease III domain-containing protein [Halanaerobiales bacterium]|nr:endonuclease III domain-containing protein [Halanaerobiales bacterium]
MYPCSQIKNSYDFSEGIKIIYEELYSIYGPQNWWPGDSRIEIIIGAILTQAVSWQNVEKAINNLKEEDLLNIKKLEQIKNDYLAELIKPSGYYNMKAKKLKSFINFTKENYNLSLDDLAKGKPKQKREELLEIYGIGPETADSILLYAFDKPEFVIDTYTKRILSRIGYVDENIQYKTLKNKIENNLKKDSKLYNEYHALLVKLAKEHCLKSSPLCEKCPLNNTDKEERYVNS